MVDNLLIKGGAKDVVIKVDDARTTVTIMIPAVMLITATMTVARNTAPMTAHVTAIGVTSNKAASITKGVVDAMITTMTGKAVAIMTLTMSTTDQMRHAAPLVCAHMANPGVTLTTLASPISLMALLTPKDHIHMLLAIMPSRTITWRKSSPTR